MKEQYLKAENIDDLMDIENDYFTELRDKFYNDLLKDEK